MGGPSPPPPPDPVATAHASELSNRNTAITQFGLNATNQKTPQGSLSYRQIGTWDDGTPRFETTQSLSPEEQQIYGLNSANRAKLGAIEGQQIDRVGGILSTPFDLNTAANNQQYDMYRKLLDPVWTQRENALESKLANQGITSGSEAQTNALRDFGMQRGNDYTSAALASRGQAVSEALANRNQPLNEISALAGGSQISMPSWAQTPQVNVAPTNVGDITNNSWNSQFQNYNAKMGQQNAMMGGLFGLAAAPLGGWAYGKGRAGGSPF